MQRFHLSLSALSEGTEVFYRPASYFEMHRAQIIAVGLVIGLLSATVLMLTASSLSGFGALQAASSNGASHLTRSTEDEVRRAPCILHRIHELLNHDGPSSKAS